MTAIFTGAVVLARYIFWSAIVGNLELRFLVSIPKGLSSLFERKKE